MLIENEDFQASIAATSLKKFPSVQVFFIELTPKRCYEASVFQTSNIEREEKLWKLELSIESKFKHHS